MKKFAGIVVVAVSAWFIYDRWEKSRVDDALASCSAEVERFERAHRDPAESFDSYNTRIPFETTQCMRRKGYELYNNVHHDCVNEVVAACYRPA
ncbi:hypothetical protein JFN94_06580 [Burkholderia anthina]|uniref:Uncharacterized protein n=1 Tax=Burkholderia anthina TaxID=179879 RepID=A0A7T7AIP7_9BURK|nr:hypothetical protein [Burkholderia anthina]QQK03822.1 hypothetical protein JFN94_06580 [Burkholderia anthina]